MKIHEIRFCHLVGLHAFLYSSHEWLVFTDQTNIITAYLWQFVQLECTCHCHISAQVRKFYVDQLPRIQRSMPVPIYKKQKVHYACKRLQWS